MEVAANTPRSLSCGTYYYQQQRDQTEEFCDQCAHTHTHTFINLRSLVPKGNSLCQNICKLNFISSEGAASQYALSYLATAKRTNLSLASHTPWLPVSLPSWENNIASLLKIISVKRNVFSWINQLVA